MSDEGEVPAASSVAQDELGAAESTLVAARRPGRLRRVAAGAWHVPASCVFLLSHPRLWPLAAIPTLFCGASLGAGFALGIYALYSVERSFGLSRGSVSKELLFSATVALWSATIVGAVLFALGATLVVCSPLLDRLALRVLTLGGQRPPLAATAWRFRLPVLTGFLLLVLTFLACALGLVPWAGPLLQVLAGAFVLGTLVTELPLSRSGRDLPARRRWHREWRCETFGLGLGAVLLLPLLNVLAAVGLVAGAARLVIEIEDLAR